MLKMVDLFYGTLENVDGVDTLAKAVSYVKEFWCNETDEVRVSLTSEVGAKRTVDKYTLAIVDDGGECIDIYGLFIA